MAAALARALAAQAAAVVQTTAFRRRALQVAVQSAAKRFRRGFIPRQLNLPALEAVQKLKHWYFYSIFDKMSQNPAIILISEILFEVLYGLAKRNSL